MFNFKTGIFILTIICIIATGITAYLLGGLAPEQVQTWLERAGIWAPIIYIVIYTIATILVLPSTALNLAGGAIFGPWIGTLWTSVAAIIAAIIAFYYSRTVGREWISQKLAGRWQAMDAEMRQGGLFYMFAIRLLPIIPYGLVNFAAGLTSVSFKDYLLGTILGTIPGVLPFVMLGSSGLTALKTGDILPLIGALSLIAMLVGGATWYRRRRSLPKKVIEEMKDSSSSDFFDN
ncbi:MAG: TVP38/TMEM64 family protein [Okeania sp. SIO2C9]|uniref:TVP38/TMEM64 family protein n=1 Tax=Okeania sp. SIO2C9 TaxID=2607791 RepID=UPI0013BF214C|nr:TVP38/TMEM64 family protein [Okeania sp. SIO2C9]NEQ74485.1 TVP38/TMEM64 family protein [Okeania sp. SIO2C9]